MKLIILLTFIFLVNSADIKTCLCSNLYTEFDCSNAVSFQAASQDLFDVKACIWLEGQCIDIIKDFDFPCVLLDEDTCNNVPSCAWQNLQCQKFTKCSDYTYEKSILSKSCDDISCLDNGTQCAFDIIGRNEQYCEDIAFEEDCSRIYLLYKKTLCNWNGSACVGQRLSSCSSLTEKQCLQANAQCAWKNSSCVKRTCEDGQYPFYQSEGVKLCSSYLDIETDQIMYCEINEDGLCATSNPEDLDRRNCYAQSFQQYFWNPEDEECQMCL
ncbi:unnamed protein product [Paramecium primaurelia]|uniref:Uncharacterized protein n=1 Tax=Paramecium primaurelia TaxID=5886 RepID=A0A8S1M504_PARPR|nr:unnamed protein product [Paramecium primaurelia]